MRGYFQTILFSCVSDSGSLWKESVKLLSCVTLFVTPWTVGHQAPLSMGFSSKEYWSGLPFPPPGILPHPGAEPLTPALAGGFFTTAPPGEPFRSMPRVRGQSRDSNLAPGSSRPVLSEQCQACGKRFEKWGTAPSPLTPPLAQPFRWED